MTVGSRIAPRSVADATRFTASTPHASTKSTPRPSPPPLPSSSSPSSTSRSKQPSPSSSQQSHQSRGGSGSGSIPPPPPPPQQRPQQPPGETMEERVRRLRAAHLAAKQHDVSRFDRVVSASRRWFDAAHKFTVMGLIGFSGLALFVTVYATGDMMIYNRKRRGEFFTLQQQLREDSLEAARLAYMTGAATEEQVAMVEEATARARETGVALPSLLSPPQQPLAAANANANTTDSGVEGSSSSSMMMSSAAAEVEGKDEEQPQKKKSITGWLFSGLKKGQDEDQDQGELNFGREEAAARAAAGGESQSQSQPQPQQPGLLRDKARAAFGQERENQRRGGPLDQVGLADGAAAESEGKESTNKNKKGWLW